MSKPKQTVSFTVVAYKGLAVPLDMFRYDHCWPATQESVSQFTEVDNSILLEEPVHIRVTGTRIPTVERWNSFGWEVIYE